MNNSVYTVRIYSNIKMKKMEKGETSIYCISKKKEKKFLDYN